MIGSVAGWAGGIGIAALLKGVFDGFGFALPAGGLVLRTSSSVLAVTAGVAATVLAGVLPVLRASRVPPLAALRELAAEPARVSRIRSVLGLLLIAGGAGAVIAGTTGGGQGAALAGAVGTLAGFVVLGPVAVRPAAAVLGAPIAALRGVGGRLARDNALRNPRRTAATASGLMVGVAVAAMFTVTGASLKASAAHGVDTALTADLVVDQAGYGGSAELAGFRPERGRPGRLPSVGVAAGVSRGSVLLDGQARTIAAADPGRIGEVVNLGLTAGSLRRGRRRFVRGVGQGRRGPALAGRQHGAGRLPRRFPRPAAGRGHLRPPGHHRRLPVRGGRVGPARRAGARPMVLIKLKPSVRLGSAQAAVTAATAAAGQPRVQDQDQYLASATSGVNTILGLVYVMLALAIVIALMGVANTLSSIHERTASWACCGAGADPGAGPRHDPVGVGDHRGVRDGGRGDPRDLPGLGRGPVIQQYRAGHVRGAAAAAGPVPRPGRAHGILAGIRPARRAARLPLLPAIAAA